MKTAHSVPAILHLLRRVSVPSVVFVFAVILSPQSIYFSFLFKVLSSFFQHSFSDWFPDTKNKEKREGDIKHNTKLFLHISDDGNYILFLTQ